MNNRFFEALRGYFPDWYLPDVYWTDIVEIVIVAFLIYQLMVWIKNTKAWMLLKGILVLAVFILVAAILRMNTMDCKEQCVDPCDSGDCGVSAGASAGAGKAWGKAVPYSDCAA